MTKFWMIRYRLEQATIVLFAREDNGMIVGAAEGSNARFGENPNETMHRSFMDQDCAVEWVKRQCREYAGREDVDFLSKEGDPQIVVPWRM